jgi:hypothetical protein
MLIGEICEIVSIGWIFALIGWYLYKYFKLICAISHEIIYYLTMIIYLRGMYYKAFTFQEWAYLIIAVTIPGFMIYYLWGDNKFERYYYEKNWIFFLILYMMRICLLMICIFYISRSSYIIGGEIFIKMFLR